MNKLKTLLERAKPEVVEALEMDKGNLPYTYERIYKFLNENYFVNDMTWSIWIDLRSTVYQKTKVIANDPWELFETI